MIAICIVALAGVDTHPDGVALHSTAHPSSPDLSPDALETAEIKVDIPWYVAAWLDLKGRLPCLFAAEIKPNVFDWVEISENYAHFHASEIIYGVEIEISGNIQRGTRRLSVTMERVIVWQQSSRHVGDPEGSSMQRFGAFIDAPGENA